MGSLLGEIKKRKHRVFRRIYMKRRQSDGEYEPTWQRIPDKYIKRYGSIKYSVDDVLPNVFKTGAFKFKVLNKDGYFSDTTEDKSFFFGYLTQQRTFVKVEGGYIGEDGTEYPTNSTLFVGLLSEDKSFNEDSIVDFSCKHVSSVLDEFPSDQVPGLGSTQTASEVITKIKDYTDSNSIAIFQKYISTGGWNIQTSTTYYNLATSTSLQNLSCWKLIQKLSEAENYVAYIDQFGDFFFKDRENLASDSSFHFSGVGDTDKTYGHNIMQQISVDDNIRKVYNRVRVKFNSGDTISSYYIRNEAWDWGDSSSSFIYGVREYKYNNTFLDSATAITVGDTIYNEFNFPKKEIKLKAKFLPQLMVQDKVDITYQTQLYSGDDLWNYFNWGDGIWGERSGYNINLTNAEQRITNITHNLENFSSMFVLRAL